MRTAFLLFLLLCTTTVTADSGLIRTSVLAGPRRVTVMTDPTPIRVGSVDISVLIQHADSGEAVLDSEVSLRLENEEANLLLTVPASRAHSGNQLLHSATFLIPASGHWKVVTTITQDGVETETPWSFTAADPLPPLATLWPWFLPAALALLLYAANQRLRTPSTPTTS